MTMLQFSVKNLPEKLRPVLEDEVNSGRAQKTATDPRAESLLFWYYCGTLEPTGGLNVCWRS